MSIILFVTVCNDGLGDLSFMVKVANHLQRDHRVTVPMVFVSEYKTLVEKHFQLNNKVKLLSIDEFSAATHNQMIIPTLIIEGPYYYAGRGIHNVSTSVPILYLTEYSYNGRLHFADIITLLSKARKQGIKAVALESGLGKATAKKIEYEIVKQDPNETGIIIDKELLTLSDELNSTEAEVKKKSLFQLLDAQVKARIGSFLENQLMYFHYSQEVSGVSPFIDKILEVNQSEKSCMMVTVGKLDRESQLNEMKNKLIARGFSRIIYADAAGKEKVLHDKEDSGKDFKMIHLEKISHDDFIRLMALSNTIAGVTGDQSFSEAVALGKIPIYECRIHKNAFYKGLLTLCEKLHLINLKDFFKKAVFYLEETNEEKIDSATNFDLNKIQNEFKDLKNYIIRHYDYLEKVSKVTAELCQTQPSASCARGKLLLEIDRYINQAASLHSEKQDPIMQSFIVLLQSKLESGFSISEAIVVAKIDLAAGNFSSKFFKSATLPPFVIHALEQEKNEVKQIEVDSKSVHTSSMKFNL